MARGGKSGTPTAGGGGRRVVVVKGGNGGGAGQKKPLTLSERFAKLDKKAAPGGAPKPGTAKRQQQSVQRTADKRFAKVMAKRTGGTPVAPKKPVPVAGAGAQKAGGGKKQKQKGLPVGKGKGNKGPKTPAAAKPSKEALDTDLDTYMAAPAPAQDAPAHGGVAAPMAE